MKLLVDERVLSNGSKDEHPVMATWRVAAQVADPAVEGEQQPAFICCCSHDHRVTLTGEYLLDHRVRAVALQS